MASSVVGVKEKGTREHEGVAVSASTDAGRVDIEALPAASAWLDARRSMSQPCANVSMWQAISQVTRAFVDQSALSDQHLEYRKR
jgi:Fe-S-cluster-containing hydrogenase component 2